MWMSIYYKGWKPFSLLSGPKDIYVFKKNKYEYILDEKKR